MKVQVGNGENIYGEVEAVGDELHYTGEHTDVLQRLLLSMWWNKKPDALAFVASLPTRLRGRIWAKAVNDEEKQESTALMEFNPNHDAKGQFAPGAGAGSNVSVEYRSFTKIPPALQQTVNAAIAKSSQYAMYPDNLKVIVHNQKPVDARGYYTHKDIMAGKTVVAHGPAINTFIKGQTMAEIEWNIAHEFGHADHRTRFPESEKWSSDQKEAHATMMAQKITGRV